MSPPTHTHPPQTYSATHCTGARRYTLHITIAITTCILHYQNNTGGARWTPSRFPLPVRKCHQMSSKEHIQLGWVVRWVLSTPPPPGGHPAAGRCGRVVPVPSLLLLPMAAAALPCSFVLALRELGLRLGVKAPLPLRASSRGVVPGAGAALSCSCRLPYSAFERLAIGYWLLITHKARSSTRY
jgi:hypothetical protein